MDHFSLFYLCRFDFYQAKTNTSDLKKNPIAVMAEEVDMAVPIVQQSEEIEEMNNGLEAGDERTVVQVPVKKYCLPFLPVCSVD